MTKKRKKGTPPLCLIQGTSVLEQSHSRTTLERSKKRFKAYTDDQMDIVTEDELNERLREQSIEAKRVIEQQNLAYQHALEKDRIEQEKKQQKLLLQKHPEARARLFDNLFTKRNPKYKPYLKRVKH